MKKLTILLGVLALGGCNLPPDIVGPTDSGPHHHEPPPTPGG